MPKSRSTFKPNPVKKSTAGKSSSIQTEKRTEPALLDSLSLKSPSIYTLNGEISLLAEAGFSKIQEQKIVHEIGQTQGNSRLQRFLASLYDRPKNIMSDTHCDAIQRIVNLPSIHITGDPHFYTRAIRLNKHYAINPPVDGWPYEILLKNLWQNGKYDTFAEKVREFQEVQLGLAGKNADGVLGPKTARLMNKHSKEENTNQQPVPLPSETILNSKRDRIVRVMTLLVNKYGYPKIGAAGLVGNLDAESGVLPNRVEGSRPNTPMTAQNAQGQVTTFTAEAVMNRRYNVQGPKKPGIGIAQWTTRNRRAGLFQHEYEGRVLGASILNSLDAQVDYLVTELGSRYKRVNRILKNPSSIEAASDEVVFNFERPGKVLKNKTDENGNIVYKTRRDRNGNTIYRRDRNGKKIPQKVPRRRDDPKVQSVLKARRRLAGQALSFFNENN